MKDWMLYFIIIPRRMLKEKMDYLARIESLKWDIWYYYTGIQLIITYFLIFVRNQMFLKSLVQILYLLQFLNNPFLSIIS